jgi:hypothetical protein
VGICGPCGIFQPQLVVFRCVLLSADNHIKQPISSHSFFVGHKCTILASIAAARRNVRTA